MKNTINILLLFVLLAACTSVPAGKGISYSDFPKTVKLEGQVIPLDTAVFRYPFRIRIEGGRAVVLDLHGADHFFQMFTYPDGNYLASYGKRGDSPADMLSAENFRWNGDKLWMLDANKSELTGAVFSESGDSLLRDIAVGAGWSLNLEHSKSLLCDLTLSNVNALANSTESGNECEGCASSLYICKYYGNWGGCLGTPYIFEI